MATIPLMNPFETRVLPALPRFEQPGAAPVSHAMLRLVLALHGNEQLEVWDDRIVTPDHTYALDRDFDARVTTDWRAPLTVEPELGLALLDQRGRWNLYIPEDEAQIWHAAYVLRAVCEAQGVELTELHQSAANIQAWGSPVGAMPGSTVARPADFGTAISAPDMYAPARSAPEASLHCQLPQRASLSSPGDVVLIAIAHLSVLFMPVLLPLAIWFALRHSVPQVAEQAREAVRFQIGVCVLALALLGYAGYAALAHGVASAATTGLLGYVILMSLSVVYAFYAAMRAVQGRDFLYFGFVR